MMDKNIYLNNGYLNVQYVLRYKVPFIFCIGGRGTGKTYGALKYALENNIKFLYMRRTQSQADLISRTEFSPFKAICRDTGALIAVETVTKYNSAFYRGEMSEDKIIPSGAPIGYTLALSTVSNLRGFDMSDCDLLIYDEFIPETHERPLKNEARAFFNAYETINRNRELTGSAPLKCLLLANANEINNPLFAELNLIDKAFAMEKSGQVVSINESRGYALIMLSHSPVSEKKSTTALYNLTSETDYAEMSINNSFSVNYQRRAKINILEYIPIFEIDGIVVYSHKSRREYYVSTHKSGGAPVIDRRLYRKQYANILEQMDARGMVQFENLALREKLLNG